MKPYYIVPFTSSYYDTVEAESPEEALCSFTDNMDSDMSAYFRAVDKKPAAYPHEYQYPDGKFELAMSIITATMTENEASAYYNPNGLGNNVHFSNMGAVAKLQETYDLLASIDKKAVMAVRGKFYKVLKGMTGFAFDKKPESDHTELNRIHVGEDLDAACDTLNDHGIPYDIDSGDRLIIEKEYLKEAMDALEDAGIDADII